MSKAERLMQELSILLIRYDATDWGIVLSALKKGSDIFNTLEVIKKSTPTTLDNKSISKRSAAVSKLELPTETDPIMAKALMDVYKLISAKNSKISQARLRQLYLELGGKEEPPKERTPLAKMVISCMINLPIERIESITNLIQQAEPDLDGDYERWFRMINS